MTAAPRRWTEGEAWSTRVLPIAAVTVVVVVVGAVLASGGSTVGYDTHAYLEAARRLLDGQPVYDASINQAGASGLFLYPRRSTSAAGSWRSWPRSPPGWRSCRSVETCAG
jgi:hypothetical protein